MNKILIIEDDPRNVFALTAVLRSRGYAYLVAPGGAEGMALLHQHNDIGIVLMDMMMPEMDGYALVARLKDNAATAAIPVVAITAQAMAGDREKCLEAGSDEYLSKPIDMDKLFELLKKYMP
jgi:CheY-like chemotaxis protein